MTEQDVLQMRQVALLMAMTTTAQATIEGMKAENAQRERKGEAPMYGEDAFEQVIIHNGLGWNGALSTLDQYR